MEDIPSGSPIVVNIDPDGDVYLVLSGKKLLVSSKILSIASKVFKALLSPNFSEGQRLSTECPGHVALPDDDSVAIEAICNVLHHCYDFPTTGSVFDFLVKIAITSDKYDCTRAMSQWSSVQLRALVDVAKDSSQQGQLLLACYMLKDYQGFMVITKLMCYSPREKNSKTCLYSSTPYDISQYHQAFLPDGLIGNIARKEWEIKNILLGDLERCLVSFLEKRVQNSGQSHSPLWYSNCDGERIVRFMRILSKRQLFPLTDASDVNTIDDLISKLRLLLVEDLGPTLGCAICGGDFIVRVKSLIERASKAFCGFCMDCVDRGNGKESAASRCRISHAGNLGLKKE